MIYHVLPGDAQVEDFRSSGIGGEVIVCREAFIVGPIDERDVNAFWERRAQFILGEYGEDIIDYHEKVADELLRLNEVGAGDEVYLWFEYELFCSVNMWYCLDQLNDSGAAVYRVAPNAASPDDVWQGFAGHRADDLLACFESRTAFTAEDIDAGSVLWRAFREGDIQKLKEMSDYRSPALPFLKEVCGAAAEIEVRPLEIVRELKLAGFDTIEKIFPEFRKRAGVYGFGDSQVERLLDSV